LFFIDNEIDFQRTFESIHFFLTVYPKVTVENESRLLWTLPSDLKLPMVILEHFDYLNSWIQELIQGSKYRLIFIAPYYSETGLEHLYLSLRTLVDTNKEIWIDWVFGETQNEENEKAYNFLKYNFKNHKNLRIYFPQQKSYERGLIIHAKVLLSDSQRGYLGSANFSKNALLSQFELGVKLTKKQTVSLERLIDYWIKNQILVQSVL